jgi:hypothetical protein
MKQPELFHRFLPLGTHYGRNHTEFLSLERPRNTGCNTPRLRRPNTRNSDVHIDSDCSCLPFQHSSTSNVVDKPLWTEG